MALRTRTSVFEEEDETTFLYRVIEMNLRKVPFEYKEEAHTTMLFRGMALLKENRTRFFVYRCLSNKALDWYRLTKRRRELNQEYYRKDDFEREMVKLDVSESKKYQGIVACLERVHKVSSDAQKRIIRDLLKFVIKNPHKKWEVKGACERLGISTKRAHEVVREIKSMYNALYKMRKGEDESTVAEIYEHIKFKR